MYEELVKKIRTLTEQETRIGLKTQAEAADAIEELSSIVKEYQKFDGFLAAHGMFELGPMIPIEPPMEKTP